MREACALQKLLSFFQHISDINIQNFKEMLTNDAVSFEQLGPGCCCRSTVKITDLEICTITAVKICVKFALSVCIFNILEWSLFMCD